MDCDCLVIVDCVVYEDGKLCNGMFTCGLLGCFVDVVTIVFCLVVLVDKLCFEYVCNDGNGKCNLVFKINGVSCSDNNVCM